MEEKIQKAWDFIKKNHIGLCRDTLESEGKGMSIFEFLPKEESTPTHNCTYKYSLEGDTLWKYVYSNLPDRETKEEMKKEQLHPVVIIVPCEDRVNNYVVLNYIKI